MTLLTVGLLLFLGAHSTRIFGEGWRTRTMARLGVGPWKAAVAVLSIVGFALLAWGYGVARQQPVVLWSPPTWTRHLAALLTLVAFVMLVAAYVPGNAIKSKLRHPMVLSVKVWAIAHLLANNTVADMVLFGAFLAWAVLDFRAARQRDRALHTAYPPGRAGPTVVTVLLALLAWAVFALWAHAAWIGVRPFG